MDGSTPYGIERKMPLIERYVLRRTAEIFLLTLCALTGALWVTRLLVELDVVTAKGQAIWVYLLMTILALPAVVQVVAPVALLVGIIVTLNSLTSDSELPIISAAGASQKAINRPILLLSIVVMLLVAVSHHVLAPASLSAFRTLLSQVRADVIATLMQDGGFQTVEDGLTMHFRERAPDGGFHDVFINDDRDPKESRTFSAAQGLLLDQAGRPFLVLRSGDLIREDHSSQEAGVVTFDTYALDLSQFGPADAAPVYQAMERSTLFLLDPPAGDRYSDKYPLRVRAELHDRITAPLYTLVFSLIALAFLGRPRTNRQDRGAAIVSVVLFCLLFRVAGFAAMAVARKVEGMTMFMYVAPLAGLAFGLYANLHDPRGWIVGMEAVSDVIARAARRLLGRQLSTADTANGR
jgi:lipopolysaccharide export system permease protein